MTLVKKVTHVPVGSAKKEDCGDTAFAARLCSQLEVLYRRKGSFRSQNLCDMDQSL